MFDVIKDVADSADKISSALDRLYVRICEYQDRKKTLEELDHLDAILRGLTHLEIVTNQDVLDSLKDVSKEDFLTLMSYAMEQDSAEAGIAGRLAGEAARKFRDLLASVVDLIELLEKSEGRMIIQEREAYAQILSGLNSRAGILRKLQTSLRSPKLANQIPQLASEYQKLVVKLKPQIIGIQQYACDLDRELRGVNR